MNYNVITENITENYGENLLRGRGIKDVERFMNPDEGLLQDWRDLENIEKGIDLIKSTIYSDEPYALIVD